MGQSRAKKIRKAARRYVRKHPQLVAIWYVEQLAQYPLTSRLRVAWDVVTSPYQETLLRWWRTYLNMPGAVWRGIKAQLRWLRSW